MKLIDADDFYENLLEWAITDKDREFAEEVKFALGKYKSEISMRGVSEGMFYQESIKALKNENEKLKKDLEKTGKEREQYFFMLATIKKILA